MTYCHTCKRSFRYRGIARHRTMHKERHETCMITYADGTYLHQFGERQSEVDATVDAETREA